MSLLQKGDNWFIDYRVNGRRKREKIGPDKKLAKDVFRKRMVEIAENRFLDVRKDPKIKFSEFADTYMETYSKLHKKSWKSADQVYLKKLIPYFGHKFLYEITPFMIEDYKGERAKQKSYRKKITSLASVNRELACLKTIFNKAIEWNKAKENPVKKVKFFRENNVRLDYLTKEEIAQLMEVCDEKLRPIVILAIFTGMRRGEILNLQWKDIDFNSNTMTLLKSKSGAKRLIPINSVVKDTLLALIKNPNGEYVFCHRNGKPFRTIMTSFFTAIQKIGRMGFVFHSLRHTFASQLVMSGVSLQTVMELMGHSDIKMTLRYAHLSPDHKQKAVEVLVSRMDTFWTPAR